MSPGGSLEIGILLVALGAVGKYRSHIENIQWFAEHVRRIIRRVFTRPGERVKVTTEDVSATEDTLSAGPTTASTGLSVQSLLLALLGVEVVLVGLVIALLVVVLID